MNQFERWLAPPVFPGDELKTRRANLLNMALWVTLLLGLFVLFGNLLGGRTPAIIIGADIAIVPMCLLLRHWMYHGEVRLASIVLLAVDLLGTSVFIAIMGTIRTPTSAFYLLIVIGAGLLCDVRGILVTTVLSSLAILGLIWAENARFLPTPDYAVTISQWVTYTVLFGLAGGLAWVGLESTRQALKRADQGLEEQKRIEEELRSSEQYARRIIDSSLDMIVTTDPERRIVEFNPAAQAAFGYRPEDVVGKHVNMLYADPERTKSIRAALLTDGKYTGEIENRRKNGEIFTSLLSAALLRDGNREIIGTFGISRDITEQKQAEQARERAEEKYRVIFDSAFEGIFQSTSEGRFVTANPALARMWGYDSPQALIAGVTDIGRQMYVEPIRRVEFERLMREQGAVREFEVEVRRRDGSAMWVSENSHAVCDVDGRLLYYEGTVADITARKREEEQAHQRTVQLEALRQTSLELTAQLDLQALLRSISERAVKLMKGTTGSIYLYNPERDLLERMVFHGPALVNSAAARRRGEGLIGRVWETRSPIVKNDYGSWVERNPAYDAAPSRAVVGIPVSWRSNFLGVLVVVADKPKEFTAEDVDLLELFADQAAIALENARLFESVERQVVQLSTLREIDRALNLTLDLAPALDTMLMELEHIVPYDSAAVLLLDGTILRAVAARGREFTALMKFELDTVNNAMFQETARTSAPVLIKNLGQSPNWIVSPGTEYAQSWLGTPLIARGSLIGQIAVFSASPAAFTRAHADILLAFANQAAVTIANARLREELSEQARRDSLTQLLNHGAFIHDLRAAGEKIRPLSLIMFDLDHFKGYNDTYGHVMGDAILRAAVESIRAHVKHQDLVGRWGGEEFVIGLLGASMEKAELVAGRIRATLTEVRVTDSRGQPIPPPTASQGIATLSETGMTVDQLIERADRALYQAKSRGRDQIARSGEDTKNDEPEI